MTTETNTPETVKPTKVDIAAVLQNGVPLDKASIADLVAAMRAPAPAAKGELTSEDHAWVASMCADLKAASVDDLRASGVARGFSHAVNANKGYYARTKAEFFDDHPIVGDIVEAGRDLLIACGGLPGAYNIGVSGVGFLRRII